MLSKNYFKGKKRIRQLIKTKINKEKLNEIREVTEENGPKDETNESQ